MRYTGFLYGHYDSRGCATFVEGTDRKRADALYLACFCPPEEDFEQWAKEMIEEEYIATAAVEADFDLTKEMDLEYRTDGLTLWCDIKTEPEEGLAFLERPFDHVEFRLAKDKPGEGWYESQFGEDAAGVVPLWDKPVPLEQLKEIGTNAQELAARYYWLSCSPFEAGREFEEALEVFERMMKPTIEHLVELTKDTPWEELIRRRVREEDGLEPVSLPEFWREIYQMMEVEIKRSS